MLSAVIFVCAIAAAPPGELPPPTPVPSAAPVVLPGPAPLAVGECVTMRVRQVLPCDRLSPAERLLNGRPPVQVGDRVLAEVVSPPGSPAALVGAVITHIEPPGKFRKPGRLTLRLGQYVEPSADGQLAAWTATVIDRRSPIEARRHLINALFIMEGIGVGASVGAQTAQGNLAWIGTGMGAGLLVGAAYTACQRGKEATLEPGDTFQVTVGDVAIYAVPTGPEFTVYPAANPERRKGKP